MFIYLKGIFLNPGGYISWSNKFGPLYWVLILVLGLAQAGAPRGRDLNPSG